MSYIPTLCDGCHRVSLTSMQGLSERPPECARCSQELRVIPSRSYTAEDVEIFDELCETVGVNLSALEAYRLSVQVDKALASGIMDRVFEPLVLRWPGLIPLLVVVGASPTRQRRSLQMLKTIFEALSMTRRSGSMARVDDLPATPAVARVPPR
jgi:hypothetical protein